MKGSKKAPPGKGRVKIKNNHKPSNFELQQEIKCLNKQMLQQNTFNLELKKGLEKIEGKSARRYRW